MRKEYDFKESKQNPYVKKVKNIQVDSEIKQYEYKDKKKSLPTNERLKPEFKKDNLGGMDGQ